MKDRQPVLQVRDLVARYGKRTILDGVSFSAYPGEILAVVGASGCGKTTLLKHCIGLLKPVSGEVLFWGRDVTRMDEDELAKILRRVGIAFQGGALFNSMTIGDNIALPLEERDRLDDDIREIVVRMALGAVGLGNCPHLMPSELSGGMKKRVGFARAMATSPDIVFFDEPSAGLDPITAAGLDRLILKLRHLLGATMIVVTHELASIRTISDRVLMLDGGRIIFTGTVREAEESRVPRVRQFFGRIPDETLAASGATAPCD